MYVGSNPTFASTSTLLSPAAQLNGSSALLLVAHSWQVNLVLQMGMRISAAGIAVLVAFTASTSVQAQLDRIDRNRYVLAIDRAPYSLDRKVRPSDSASVGSSRSYAPATKAGASDPTPLVVQPNSGELRIREQQYEFRIRELERERDAWRRQAQILESELRLSDVTGRTHSRFLFPPPGGSR